MFGNTWHWCPRRCQRTMPHSNNHSYKLTILIEVFLSNPKYAHHKLRIAHGHDVWVSLQDSPWAHDVLGTLHGHVCDNLPRHAFTQSAISPSSHL